MNPRLGVILFASGFCSLVYQVTWLRLLRLVFGASTAAQAVVVAIFMGGLGLGGYLIGRHLRQRRNPLTFYAGLEVAIALAAALSPLLVDLARWVYIAVGGSSTLGMPLATVVRWFLALGVIGGPAILMGGTLPAVSQALARRDGPGRRLVAWLYGWNTLGAVCGAFFTTFFFIEWFGVRRSLWLACAVNLLLAMWARELARRLSHAKEGTLADEETRAEQETHEEEVPGAWTAPLETRGRGLVLVAAAVVGFLFFLMEIVWYRMLAPVLGGSSYTFGLILALALLGIGLGGLLYGVIFRGRQPTFRTLAWTCALEALGLVIPFALGDGLAWLAGSLRSLSAVGFPGLVGAWTVIAGVVVLPAAILAGFQFPLLIALVGGRDGGSRGGYEVGLVYAWNTWGAILGSLAGGFGLLPLLSAPNLWRSSAALLAILALAVLWLGRGHSSGRAGTIIVALLALGLCFVDGPTAFFRHQPIGAGRTETNFENLNRLRWYLNESRRSLVNEAEGVESSVALVAREDLSLIVNGKSDGSARVDAPTQVMGGLVGALLHPDPRRSLVIGLGTGTTAGWLAAVESMERVDIVELEPAVVDFAEEFSTVNHDVLNSSKARWFEGDGRELILTSSESYDVIFSEPSNPYRAGVADLFSYEFYSAVAERLGSGGIFLQWLQGYEIDADLVATVYATMGSVFPHVETWQVHVLDLLLVASNEPIVHDIDKIRRRVSMEPYSDALRQAWRVEGVEGFYSGFLGSPRLSAVFADAPVSTDDRPAIEFGFARNVGRRQLFRIRELRDLAHRLGADRPESAEGVLDWDLVSRARQTMEDLGIGATASTDTIQNDARVRARRAWLAGDLESAAREWSTVEPDEPRGPIERLMWAEVAAEKTLPAAEEALRTLASEAPTEALAMEARWAWRRGETEKAVDLLVRAFRACREDGWFFHPVLERSLALAEEMAWNDPAAAAPLLTALAEPFAAHQLDLPRLRIRIPLAVALKDDAARCVEAFEPFEPHVPWEERFLSARASCYEATQHHLAERAFEELADFLAATAPRFPNPQ